MMHWMIGNGALYEALGGFVLYYFSLGRGFEQIR